MPDYDPMTFKYNESAKHALNPSLSKNGASASATSPFAMHGSGSSLPPLCVNRLTQDVSGQPMYIYRILPDYNLQITRCNDCNTFKVWQPYKKAIKQNSTTTLTASGVQRCVEQFPSLSRRPACMSLYLANGYLLMIEDELSFVII